MPPPVRRRGWRRTRIRIRTTHLRVGGEAHSRRRTGPRHPSRGQPRRHRLAPRDAPAPLHSRHATTGRPRRRRRGAGRPRPAHRAGNRSAAARGAGAVQHRDHREVGGLGGHREDPRRQHPGQAGPTYATWSTPSSTTTRPTSSRDDPGPAVLLRTPVDGGTRQSHPRGTARTSPRSGRAGRARSPGCPPAVPPASSRWARPPPAGD